MNKFATPIVTHDNINLIAVHRIIHPINIHSCFIHVLKLLIVFFAINNASCNAPSSSSYSSSERGSYCDDMIGDCPELFLLAAAGEVEAATLSLC